MLRRSIVPFVLGASFAFAARRGSVVVEPRVEKPMRRARGSPAVLIGVALGVSLLVLASTAWADTVGPCGGPSSPGDYIRTPTGKMWCELPGSGAWSILPYLFAALGSIYSLVGNMGPLPSFGVGLASVMLGSRLTGRPATVSGTVSGGYFNGTMRPAVEGTARSFGGRLVGVLLSLFGTLVLIMSVISWVYG